LQRFSTPCPENGSAWINVLETYRKWDSNRSLANFRKFRFRARSMVWWLEFAYSHLYLK
jgi:hypothetical protein